MLLSDELLHLPASAPAVVAAAAGAGAARGTAPRGAGRPVGTLAVSGVGRSNMGDEVLQAKVVASARSTPAATEHTPLVMKRALADSRSRQATQVAIICCVRYVATCSIALVARS